MAEQDTSGLKVEIAVVKNTVEALAKSVDKLETATILRDENLTRAIENLQAATGLQYERLVSQIAMASLRSSEDLAKAIDRTTTNILQAAEKTTLRQEATMKEQALRYEASLKEQKIDMDPYKKWILMAMGALAVIAFLWKSSTIVEKLLK